MAKKPRLELVWPNKDKVLLRVEKDGTPVWGTKDDIERRTLVQLKAVGKTNRDNPSNLYKQGDNLLIKGDNLLALKALEKHFAGKIKCIYIDPPFNSGNAFEHYDDGMEQTLWLTLLRDRLALLHKLLSRNGTLCVHIDDNELGYLIVLLDEIFGQKNKAFIATFKQGSATGHKAINPGCVATSNYVVVYAKNKRYWTTCKVYVPRKRNKRYNQFIKNRSEPYHRWKISSLSRAFALHHGVEPREARRSILNYEVALDKFVLEHADSVVQLARPDYKGVGSDAKNVIDKSKNSPKRICHLKRKAHSDMFFIRGERILFYKDTLKNIDGTVTPGEPLTTIWDDLPSHNLHNEGGVAFPKGKKPEALVKRLLDLFTVEGDWVLDSFVGSGTTPAVACKMDRRWVGVEMGEHAETQCLPRLKRVVSGKDQTGISKQVGWKGGGGFRYCVLGESLFAKDKDTGLVMINPKYTNGPLVNAVCTVEDFRLRNDNVFQGVRGNTYAHVTEEKITQGYIDHLADKLSSRKNLVVYCLKRSTGIKLPENVKIKRIPKELQVPRYLTFPNKENS